ncbi:MAG: hypothetical protein LBT40_18330 [Deltaproteobacteria bacterium]|nr:hypothetical protein [Deltaproteobacteria bacterium]
MKAKRRNHGTATAKAKNVCAACEVSIILRNMRNGTEEHAMAQTFKRKGREL